jgi:hypothetical protein
MSFSTAFSSRRLRFSGASSLRIDTLLLLAAGCRALVSVWLLLCFGLCAATNLCLD